MPPSLDSIFNSSPAGAPSASSVNGNRPSLDSIFSSSASGQTPPNSGATIDQNARPSLGDILSGKDTGAPAVNEGTGQAGEKNTVPIDWGKVLSDTWNTYKSAAPNFVSGDMGTIGKDLTKVNPGQNPIVNVGENALSATSDTLNTIFAPFGALAKGITDSISKSIETHPGIINSPLMGKVANFVQGASDEIQHLATNHPEAAQNLTHALNIALLAVGGKEGPLPEEGLDTSMGTVEGGIKNYQEGTTGFVKNVPAVTDVLDTAAAKAGEGAKQNLSDWWDQTFNATKGGANRLAKSEAVGKNVTDFLANKQVAWQNLGADVKPEINGTKLDVTKMIDRLNEDQGPMNDALRTYLENKPELMKVDDLRQKVLEAVNTPDNKAANVLPDLQKQINEEFDSYKKQYGEYLKQTDLQDIKVAKAKQSGIFDSTKPKWRSDVDYQISKAARQSIEDNSTDLNIKKLNEYIGDHQDAVKQLSKINGQTLKGGRLSKYVGVITGSTLGKSPIGKIVGMVGGNWVADTIMNLDVNNPVRNMLLKYAKDTEPEIYQQALDAIHESEQQKATRLALPEGATRVGPKTSQPITEAERAANDAKQNAIIKENAHATAQPVEKDVTGNPLVGKGELPPLKEIQAGKNRLYNRTIKKIPGGK